MKEAHGNTLWIFAGCIGRNQKDFQIFRKIQGKGKKRNKEWLFVRCEEKKGILLDFASRSQGIKCPALEWGRNVCCTRLMFAVLDQMLWNIEWVHLI